MQRGSDAPCHGGRLWPCCSVLPAGTRLSPTAQARRQIHDVVALDALDGMMPIHWAVTFLVALAIMILAALGVTLIHYNSLWSDSLGIGMGVFALVGAFMLYRIFFWHE